MHNKIATDIFNHLKNDTAKMPSTFIDDWLDDNDTRTLPVIMGTTLTEFHKQCVFTAQNYPIEKYLPLIWTSVSIKRGNERGAYNINLLLRVFSNDTSGAEHGSIITRLRLLLDGTKCEGKYLWNACPLKARYSGPFEYESETPIMPTHLHEVTQQSITFTGTIPLIPTPRGKK